MSITERALEILEEREEQKIAEEKEQAKHENEFCIRIVQSFDERFSNLINEIREEGIHYS